MRLRDARTKRIVGRARVRFSRPGRTAVILRGKRIPRKTVVEVRFVR